MRASVCVLSGVVVVFATGEAHANITPCPIPTAAECLTTAYQQSACFEKTKGWCADTYQAEYGKEYAASTAPLEPRVVPDQGVTSLAPGSITTTKILPYDSADDVQGAPGTYASYMYKLRYQARSRGGIPIVMPIAGMESRLLAALPARAESLVTRTGGFSLRPPPPVPIVVTDPRSVWDANGLKVTSCEEYAYEKYYSFSKFEDAIATAGYRIGVGHDQREMFKALIAALPGGHVDSRAGLYTIGVYSKEADRPKNDFFSEALAALTPLDYYQQLKNDQHTPGATGEAPITFPFDPDIVARVNGGLLVPGWTWDQHVTYGTAFMATTLDDQFQRYDALQAQYRALLPADQGIRSEIAKCFFFQSLVSSPPSWCNPDMVHYLPGTGTFTSPGPREADDAAQMYFAVAVALDPIDEALHKARDIGCLDPSSPQPCDWSPREIISKVLREIRSDEEVAYKRCLDFTHNDLTSSSSILTRLRTYPPPDYASYFSLNPDGTIIDGTLSTDNFDAMLSGFERWAASFNYDRDPTTGQYIIGQSAGDKSTSEGDWFGSELQYNVAWRLDNFDATSAMVPGTSPQLCDAEAHLAGTAAVRAKVLGVWADVFNAGASLNTAGSVVDYAADVRILGVPFYSPSGSSDLSVAVTLDQSTTDTLAEATAVIPVLGVPVTLKAGATGTLGFHGQIDNTNGGAVIQRNCADPNAPILLGVHGLFKPYASLDGFASASIDIGIAEGGVKGELTLLRLELPLDVKIAIGLVPPPNQQGAPLATLDVEAGLKLDFSTLDGRVVAFLDYPLGSVERTLASWSGLHYSHDVFDRSSTVPLSYITVIDKLGAP